MLTIGKSNIDLMLKVTRSEKYFFQIQTFTAFKSATMSTGKSSGTLGPRVGGRRAPGANGTTLRSF